MGEPGRPDAVTATAFAAAALIGGSNFVAVKISLDELEALFGAALRFGAACAIFLLVLLLTRGRLPHGRALVGALLYGGLGFGVAYACMYLALLELSVGVVAVLMGTVPVLTLALAALHGMETVSLRGVAGGALAVAGIAVLSAGSLGADVPLGYLLLAVAAPVAVAEATIVAKRFPRTDPIATNVAGMAVGAALLAAVSVAAGEAWTLPESGTVWAATAWLVVAGSVGMFWLFLVVVRRWSASATAYVTPLMPVAALPLAALFADEPVGAAELAGALLVAGGVYLGTVRARPRESLPEAPAVRSS